MDKRVVIHRAPTRCSRVLHRLFVGTRGRAKRARGPGPRTNARVQGRPGAGPRNRDDWGMKRRSGGDGDETGTSAREAPSATGTRVRRGARTQETAREGQQVRHAANERPTPRRRRRAPSEAGPPARTRTGGRGGGGSSGGETTPAQSRRPGSPRRSGGPRRRGTATGTQRGGRDAAAPPGQGQGTLAMNSRLGRRSTRA